MEIKYITLADVATIEALKSFSKDKILAFEDVDAVIVYDMDGVVWTLYYNGSSQHTGHAHTLLHGALKSLFNSHWGLYRVG